MSDCELPDIILPTTTRAVVNTAPPPRAQAPLHPEQARRLVQNGFRLNQPSNNPLKKTDPSNDITIVKEVSKKNVKVVALLLEDGTLARAPASLASYDASQLLTPRMIAQEIQKLQKETKEVGDRGEPQNASTPKGVPRTGPITRSASKRLPQGVIEAGLPATKKRQPAAKKGADKKEDEDEDVITLN